jgi:hypothetical protein
MAIAVVVANVVAVVVLCAVLARQGSVGKLSEEHSKPEQRRPDSSNPAGGGSQGSRHQWSGVMERPAGPDAEAMNPDPAGDQRAQAGGQDE